MVKTASASTSGRTIGLVAGTRIFRSFIARMPTLLDRLGPIKAASYAVARRASNSLRAGYAISDYSTLASCDIILVAVDEHRLERVVHDLALRAAIQNQLVVLCDSSRDSAWAAPLWKAARVVSVNPLEGSSERVFVAEGDPNGLNRLRRMLAMEDRRMIRLKPKSKAIYYAGVHMAGDLLLPWIAGAVDTLCVAGFSRPDAKSAAEALATQALHRYRRAGYKSGTGPSARGRMQEVARQIEILHSAAPGLAAMYREGVRRSIAFFAPKMRVKAHS